MTADGSSQPEGAHPGGAHPDGAHFDGDGAAVDSASGAGVDDPFGTAAIRAATLAAWTTSPTRLREDANLEEDHGHGYYRDRVVVELAQNAADAAAAAGAPGRLLLRLGHDDGGPVLLAANSGAPLTHRGVLALASMRASAKSDAAPSATAERETSRSDAAGADPVGRFGVGFAAVRAVSDDVVILSGAGPEARPRGIRFSARLVHDLLADLRSRAVHGDTSAVHSAVSTMTDALTHALERPLADLPILRLPFPADVPPLDTLPPGYDTAVVVRLRGPQERDLAARQLADVDDALLLALPALAEVRVEVEGAEPRVVSDVAERWRVVTRRGHHHAADLADRPHEERTRAGWSVTWAAPRDPSARRRHVVHAPTPTDEPCSLPGLLVATFPLDPSRRHVQPGAATRALVGVVGAVYADLVAELAAAGEDPLAWVSIGLPAGVLDAEIHAAALEELRRRPLLHAVMPSGTAGDQPDAETPASALISAREAQVIAGPVGHDPHCLTTLASGLAGLVTAPPGSDALARVRALGVVVRDLADVVETLPTGGRPITQWREAYDALARHVSEPGVADALAALPVPLADGRTVRGPRGTLLPAERTVSRPKPPVEPSNSAFGESGEGIEGVAGGLGAFAAFGLRVVHPDAAHPLLVRLGAVEASAATLLAHPAVRAGVAAAAEDLTPPEETGAVVGATLALVAAALDDGATPAALLAAHPWLARLPLPDVEGALVPAHDLALPGGWANGVLDALHPAEPSLVDTYGADVLSAVGVRDGLLVVRVADVAAELPLDEPVSGTPEATLDGWTDYLAHLADVLGPGTYVGEASAVADLDAVADDAWPAVLARLTDEPAARAALLTPVRVGGREAPSYTAWWLRDLLDAPFAAPGSRIPFLPPPPALLGGPDAAARLDPEVLAAVGAVTDVLTLDAEGWGRFLDALPDVGRPVPLGAALAVWRGLAAAALAGVPLTPPDRLPALRRPAPDDAAPDAAAPLVVVVPAEDAAVAAGPAWGQLADVVPAPAEAAAALAAALDVALLDGDVEIDGDRRPAPTPPAVVALLPAVPRTWWEHDELTVDGHDVDWWVTPDREVHAATTAGLARALALAAGRWELHAAVELVLADPQRAAELAVDAAWLPSTPHV